jgi:hypothetical protein
MRKAALITMFLILALGCVEASGADWKFFGGSVLLKDETTIGYYDVESIEYLSNGNVRVWTKTVNPSEVERISGKKEVIEKAARKLIDGYYPPYALLNPYPKTSFDDFINIIGWEEAANYVGIKPRLRVLFEINCKGKMIRALSTTAYNDAGVPSSSKGGEWDYIGPETNSETLQKILCKDKK